MNRAMTYEERMLIKMLVESGSSPQLIAETIHRSITMVYEELRIKGEDGKYDPNLAQRLADERRSNRKPRTRKLQLDKDLTEEIAHLIRDEHLNLPEIQKRLGDRAISINAMRSAIRDGIIPGISEEDLNRQTVVLKRDQIHLQKWVQKKAGIKEGDELEIAVDGEKIILTKKPSV